jgi:hypothetical protein
MRELARSFRALPTFPRVAIGGALLIAAVILASNVPTLLATLVVVGLVILAVALVLAFVGLCSLPFVGFGLGIYGLVRAFRAGLEPAPGALAPPAFGGGSQAAPTADPAPRSSADLPPEIAARVERIQDRAAALRSPGQSVFLSAEDQQHIDRTLNEYLPNCLATYQALPAGSADRAAGPEGETAGELVERQLGLLEESLDAIGQRVFQAGAAQLVAQQRFLEERLRPHQEADLHL